MEGPCLIKKFPDGESVVEMSSFVEGLAIPSKLPRDECIKEFNIPTNFLYPSNKCTDEEISFTSEQQKPTKTDGAAKENLDWIIRNFPK